MTEWRDIPGYDGYQASSDGEVRSIDRTVWFRPSWKAPNGYKRWTRGRVLKPAPGTTSDHLMVMAGRGRNLMVHVAVALAFLGRRPDGKEVLHHDGDPTNNTPANLRYGTRSENLRDETRLGKRRLSYQQADNIRQRRRAGESLPSLAADYKINTGQVWHICKGHQYAR